MASSAIEQLAARYDPEVVDLLRPHARVRLEVGDGEAVDAVLSPDGLQLERANGHAPDARLSASAQTWAQIARDTRAGMRAYEAGRLTVRHDLHLGVAFLAATSGLTDEGRLRFASLDTEVGRISTCSAGEGPPLIALHGLGATKASFLPTVAALGEQFRVTAIDLPGFGDSDKPLRAAYDAPYFARAVVAVLDALGLDRAHLIGNSLGGRIAIETGLRSPERVDRMVLLAPSLAWRRSRPWAPLLRMVPTKLGAVQPAPRWVVENIVRRVVPGARDGWSAAGVDEFLRAYLTPGGRAAFYTAASKIYLEEPEGKNGFWPRLSTLSRPALFVWGREDRLVPMSFERHVQEALPAAEHLELPCGHVPQLERPKETHEAAARFLERSET